MVSDKKRLPRVYVIRHGQTEWSISGQHTFVKPTSTPRPPTLPSQPANEPFSAGYADPPSSRRSGRTDIPLTQHGEDVVRELGPKVVGPGSKSAPTTFPLQFGLHRALPTARPPPALDCQADLNGLGSQSCSTLLTSRSPSSRPGSVRARRLSSCLRVASRPSRSPTTTRASGTMDWSRA